MKSSTHKTTNSVQTKSPNDDADLFGCLAVIPLTQVAARVAALTAHQRLCLGL